MNAQFRSRVNGWWRELEKNASKFCGGLHQSSIAKYIITSYCVRYLHIITIWNICSKCWINSYFVYLFSCFISSSMGWKRMVPCPQRLSCTNTTSKMHKRQQFIDQWLYCYQRNAHLYSYVHTALATITFKKAK